MATCLLAFGKPRLFFCFGLCYTDVNRFRGRTRVPVTLCPLFVVLFVFCFAVTLGIFWEIAENLLLHLPRGGQDA